jgi:hypothetical protein
MVVIELLPQADERLTAVSSVALDSGVRLPLFVIPVVPYPLSSFIGDSGLVISRNLRQVDSTFH